MHGDQATSISTKGCQPQSAPASHEERMRQEQAKLVEQAVMRGAMDTPHAMLSGERRSLSVMAQPTLSSGWLEVETSYCRRH